MANFNKLFILFIRFHVILNKIFQILHLRQKEKGWRQMIEFKAALGKQRPNYNRNSWNKRHVNKPGCLSETDAELNEGRF